LTSLWKYAILKDMKKNPDKASFHRATDADIDNVMAFMDTVTTACNENSTATLKSLGILVTAVRESWDRVVFGYAAIADDILDKNKIDLDYKPSVKKAMSAYKYALELAICHYGANTHYNQKLLYEWTQSKSKHNFVKWLGQRILEISADQE